jgi:hypothetical protein
MPFLLPLQASEGPVISIRPGTLPCQFRRNHELPTGAAKFDRAHRERYRAPARHRTHLPASHPGQPLLSDAWLREAADFAEGKLVY